jgi:hypothetical protein
MKLFVACAVAVAAGAATAAAGATGPPQPAAGAGTATPAVLTNVQLADGNVVADFTQQGVIAGTFTGTFTVVGHVITHPDGTTNADAFVTFTGTTPCGAGTVVFQANSRTVAGIGPGHAETVEAATNTANIQSNTDIAFAGPAFTYSGTYHCR